MVKNPGIKFLKFSNYDKNDNLMNNSKIYYTIIISLEVPVSLIYGNHKPSVTMFDFISSPRDYTDKGEYVPKE